MAEKDFTNRIIITSERVVPQMVSDELLRKAIKDTTQTTTSAESEEN